MPFNKNKVASAHLSGSSPTSIGSITFTDYYEKETVFDATVLKKLYGKILGQNTATYDELVTTISAGYRNFANFKDVVLEFGGFKWAVTYVTEATNGDISATLILSENIPNVYYQWNTYTSSSNVLYPSNMYSSSKIRVETLNAGGDDGIYAYNSSADGSAKYSTDGNTLTTVSRNDRINNRWAAFTLSKDIVGKKSLTNYILQPKFLDYQRDENLMNYYNTASTTTNEGGTLSPNEAYGIPEANNTAAGTDRWSIYAGDNLNYGGDTSTGQATNTKTGYSDWQYDYLWLASSREIGTPAFGAISNRAVEGIWGVKTDRSNLTSIRAASDNYWLRGGGLSNPYNVMQVVGNATLVSESGSINPYPADSNGKLRPCLHLNLTAAEAASKATAPTEDTTEFKYTGGNLEYKPKGFDSNVMDISGNTATNVGTHTVTVTLKNGYVWGDGATEEDGTTPKKYTFDFVIGKGTPIVDPSYEAVEHRYPTDGLPTLTNSGTAGTFEWKDDQTPSVGTHEYAYTFTPANTDNWNTYDGTIEITYEAPSIKSISAAVKENADIYDLYTADQLKEYLKVTATYQDNSTHPVLSKDYTVKISTNGGKLVAGDTNTLLIQESGSSKIVNFDIPTVLEAKIDSFVLVQLSGYNYTYPVQESDIIDALTDVMVMWNYSPDTAEALTDFSNLSIVGTLDAGTQSIKLKSGDVESSAFNIIIAKGSFEIKATFDGDTVTYDGEEHGLEIVWQEEIEGVTAVYLYECAANGYSSADKPTNAGEYTVTVSFTHENENYNAITDTLSAKLTIEQADYPDANKITFEDATKTFGGEHSLIAENVPNGVKVVYVYDGNEDEEPFVFSNVNENGYEVEAKFTFISDSDNNNYKAIPSKTAKLIITNKTLYNKDDLTVTGEGVTVEGKTLSATYKGGEFAISVAGKVKDKDGGEVTSDYTTQITIKRDNAEVSVIKDAGSYDVIVKYTMPAEGDYADYETSFEIKYILTVNKADFSLSENGISLKNKSVPYDGEEHSIEIEGELPEWLSVRYEGNGQSETGTHTVTAKFSHSNSNYNAVTDLTATLTIGAGDYQPEFTFEDKTLEYNGNSQTIALTGEIPEWITVEYYLNGEKFEGETEIGEYVVTAKFTHENETYGQIADMTAKLNITKAKITAPKYTGTHSYTGSGIIPKSSDFEAYDTKVLKLESTSGVNAGEYKAEFTLLDTDHYEWSEEDANKVSWKIGKATLTATKTSGRLPEFASESYQGEFGQVVSFKYFTDATCSEEVHPDDLQTDKEYFVKAVLADSENFDVDENAFTYFELGFKHTLGEVKKESNFFKDNWMWIAIGAGVLLLALILLFALTRRKAPADNYDDYADYDYDDEEDDEDDEDYDDYDDYGEF